MTREKGIKVTVIKTWVRRGIKDFYLAYYIRKQFPQYRSFFLQQGLEKMCKAYILGKRASEYESSSKQEALDKVNRIVKERGLRHGLKNLIHDTLPAVLSKEYDSPYGNNTKIIGEKYVEILERGYDECRYPTPDPLSRKTLNPLTKPGLRKFVAKVGFQILEKIEQEFQIKIPLRRFKTINIKDWSRFKKRFFLKMV